MGNCTGAVLETNMNTQKQMLPIRWYYFIGEPPFSSSSPFAMSEYKVTPVPDTSTDEEEDIWGLVYVMDDSGIQGTIDSPAGSDRIYSFFNEGGVVSYLGEIRPGKNSYRDYVRCSTSAISGKHSGRYAPPRLFGVVGGSATIENLRGTNGLEQFDDAIIYGKYTLKTNGISILPLVDYSFPCNVTWNDKTYTQIGATTVSGAYETNLKNSVNIMFHSFSKEVNPIGVSLYNIDSDYYYIETQITSDVLENYSDGVLDFGTTPQHVPKFFKDWLIENSEEIILPMELSLFKNSAEPNRLDKMPYLKLVGTITGTLRNETSVTDVVMQIEYSKFPDFNYAYLAEFGRYYYVTDIISIRNNLWEIHLSVDVLMTYKDAIMNCKAYVDRTSLGIVNKDVPDDRLIITPGYNMLEFTVPNDIITSVGSGESGSYVLNGFLFSYGSINSQSAQSNASDSITDVSEDNVISDNTYKEGEANEQ